MSARRGARSTRLRTKRVYEPADDADGVRVLIDRLWPRGIAKAAARIDYWARDVAPSTELRRWYEHDPDKWSAFRERYFAELDANPDGVAALRRALGAGPATIVFSSKEERWNNATALVEYLARAKRRA
ncbi:MAG: DUF488 family protein [Myxococcota bacterium]